MSEENGRTVGLSATVPVVEVADIYLNLGIQDSLGLKYGLLRAERVSHIHLIINTVHADPSQLSL